MSPKIAGQVTQPLKPCTSDPQERSAKKPFTLLPPIIPPGPSANSAIWFIAMKCIRKGIRGRNCQQWILPQPEATNCRVVNLLSEVITVPRNATGCWVAMAAVHSNYFSCLNKPQVPRDCINKSQMRTGTSFKVLFCIHSQHLLGLSFYFSANIYFSLPSIWSISLFGFPHRHLSYFCQKA